MQYPVSLDLAMPSLFLDRNLLTLGSVQSRPRRDDVDQFRSNRERNLAQMELEFGPEELAQELSRLRADSVAQSEPTTPPETQERPSYATLGNRSNRYSLQNFSTLSYSAMGTSASAHRSTLSGSQYTLGIFAQRESGSASRRDSNENEDDDSVGYSLPTARRPQV